MSDPLAETLLVFESAMSSVKGARRAIHDVADGTARRIPPLVDVAGSRRVSEVLPRHVSAVRRVVDDGLGDVMYALDGQRRLLRSLLWGVPAPTPGSGRGQLRALSPAGEPQVPDGVRFERRPLILPERLDIGFARQGPRLGVCYLAATLSVFGHAAPEFLVDVAREEDGAVIVTMPGRTYRLEPTLPVWEDTGELYSISSPDGSTLAAYLEKAAALHFGSYKDLVGGFANGPMGWLVGGWKGPRVGVRKARNLTDSQLRAIAKAGRPVVLSIGEQSSEEYEFGAEIVDELDLVEAHAYAVRAIDDTDSFVLREPQDELHPRDVPMARLRRVNATIYHLAPA